MSEYRNEYCSVCKKRTEHEDGYCMPCAESMARRTLAAEEAMNNAGLFYDTIVIGRQDGGFWVRMVLSGIYIDGIAPFYMILPNGDAVHVEMVAPLPGNERVIGTMQDAHDLWDADRINLIDS